MASLRTPCPIRMSASLVRHTFIQLEKGTRALSYLSTNPHDYFLYLAHCIETNMHCITV